MDKTEVRQTEKKTNFNTYIVPKPKPRNKDKNHLGKAVDCLLHLALASAKKNGIHSGFYFTQPLIETEKQPLIDTEWNT